MTITDSWALLWSQRQNALHIEPLADTLSAGRRAYRDNRASDFVPLFIGQLEDVRAAADHIRPTLQAREPVRALAHAA